MAKRTRINRPYPTHTLQDVVPIAETIQEVNGGRPVRTGMLAESLGTSTKSSMLIQKLNSSAKYGLTNGAHSSEVIELTNLGEMLTAPVGPDERDEALRTAANRPDIFAGFYEIYSGKRMPSDVYASNTLERDLGLRRELTDECLQILRLNGLFAGIITDVDGIQYVGSAPAETAETPEEADEPSEETEGEFEDFQDGIVPGVAVVGVVGVVGDSRAEEIKSLLNDLTVTVNTVNLDMTSKELVPRTGLDALSTAQGCVLVWPENGASDRAIEPDAGASVKVWACLERSTYGWEKRVVVVLGDGTSGGLTFDTGGGGPAHGERRRGRPRTVAHVDGGSGTGPSHQGVGVVKKETQGLEGT